MHILPGPFRLVLSELICTDVTLFSKRRHRCTLHSLYLAKAWDSDSAQVPAVALAKTLFYLPFILL